MTHESVRPRRTSPRTWPASLVALLAVACLAWPASAAHAHGSGRRIPPGLEVPPGHRLFLVGHAVGTQNYVCVATPSGVAWSFFGPQATLFTGYDTQLSTHFLSPNPDESGTPRATWQDSHDTSAVWAMAIETSTDPDFVEPGAIPWLLLKVVGAEVGPRGGRRLSDATFIHRINTSGGVMPATGCAAPADAGKKALVPYATEYLFYKATRPW